MFNNRPAMRKAPTPRVPESQANLSDLDKDFLMIRDAVQKKVQPNVNQDYQ